MREPRLGLSRARNRGLDEAMRAVTDQLRGCLDAAVTGVAVQLRDPDDY